MLIAGELLLVCLDERTGRPKPTRSRLGPALGAALVVELVLRERITITPGDGARSRRGHVQLISTVPTDDTELDWAIDHLQTWTDLRTSRLVADLCGLRIVDRLASRLVSAGVLVPGAKDLSWMITDPAPQRKIRTRIHDAVVAGADPTERTAALISLLDSIGRLTHVVRDTDAEADRTRISRRAAELGRGDWAARTAKAVTATRRVNSWVWQPGGW